MAKRSFIRVWREVDTDDVSEHLLIAGTISADCAKCREIGISFEAKACPKCGTAFEYIGTRISSATKELRRIRGKRPDLATIDYNDFKEIAIRERAKGIF